ncbi:Pentatricopeptide repeat, partial [Dillenia turbinata]
GQDEENIELNADTLNIVVNRFCRVGKLQKAGDVENMKVWGFLPSVVTYNYPRGRAGKMYKSDALLKEMVAKNVCPNEIIYNVLIDGYCKEVNVSSAMRVSEEMRQQGLRTNVATYNSLINGFCSQEKLSEAIG